MPTKLSDEEARRRVGQLTGWRIEPAGSMEKVFTFPDFVTAVGFVNRLTPLAEAAGHHPDLVVGWGRVRVRLTTHDVGGLTDADLALAAQIDGLER